MSAPICESFMRFDLPPESRHHEDVNPGGPGVDFEVASAIPLWLEVKNWDAPVIPIEHRSTSDQDFIDKTNPASSFWDAMVAKFEATHDCLESIGQRPPKVSLGVLLESRLFLGVALAPAISILEAGIAASSKLKGSPVGVFNLATFGVFVTGAKARRCPVSSYPQCDCSDPVDRCAAKRRKHVQTAT